MVRIVLSLLMLITLAGCTGGAPEAQPEELAAQRLPQAPGEGMQEEKPLPALPLLEHPAQLIFRSDSVGFAPVNSSGELLILRGPHSAGLSARVARGGVEVEGEGSGKLILASGGEGVLYFSRMWVSSIRSPSFAILPGEEVVFLRHGERAELPVRVVPVGNFREEVRLSAKSSTPAVVVRLSASGAPPFNATMEVFARGLVGDGHHIVITGVAGEEKVESYVRINNPVRKREGGLLSTLLRLVWIALLPVTLTVSIALGFITGTTVGAVGMAAVLANPLTFFTPEMVELLGAGPEAGVAVTKQFLQHYSAAEPFGGGVLREGRLTGISTIAVANSSFKVLLPRVELSPAVGQEVLLPVYVAGEGEVVLNVSAPPGVEAQVEPVRGRAPFRATLKLLATREAPKRGLIFRKAGAYQVTLSAASSSAEEVYRVYLKPVRRDYEVRLSSDVVYVEPGKYAAVGAVVVRNNRFAPEEYAVATASPPGIQVHVEPERGRTPFAANITVRAEEGLKAGRYTVRIGNGKLEVVVGRDGYALVVAPGVSITQGGAGSIEAKVYAVRDVAHQLRVELPLNHTVAKRGEYSYAVEVAADRYTPPGSYRGVVTYGEQSAEVWVNVAGTPVVVEHEATLRLRRGESSRVELRLVPAGYEGELALNFTATPGIVVEPNSVRTTVPGVAEVTVRNPEGTYGSVSYHGRVVYNGTPYGIAGTISVWPGQ